MTFERIIMLATIPLFTWTGIACYLGVLRFRYPPLLILGTGYLAWVGSFLLFLGVGRNVTAPLPLLPAAILFLLGVAGIFGYRLTFYPRMKARGITPKRLFGFGAKG